MSKTKFYYAEGRIPAPTETEFTAFEAGALTLDAGQHYSSAINLQTEMAASGDVQLQLRGSDGEWFTPDDASYTITVTDTFRIERRNGRALRIIATGDAVFSVTGADI